MNLRSQPLSASIALKTTKEIYELLRNRIKDEPLPEFNKLKTNENGKKYIVIKKNQLNKAIN